MTEEDRKPDEPAETEAPETDADRQAPEPEAEGAPDAEADPIEALTRENEALKDQALRAMAEAQNARRRADEEVAKSKRYGISAFAKDLVGVADNLSRGLEAVPAEAREAASEPVKNLLVGLEMVEREMLACFERHGIRKIDPKGEKFSYDLHQAMQEMEGTGQPPGTVVHVLQPGYILHDRLLRPAMVIVAKGEAKPADPPAGKDGSDGVDVTA